MSNDAPIAASLAIDALGDDARAAFSLAAEARFHGIAFATNHPQLTPDELSSTGRRDLKRILASKHLALDALRIAAPRTALADPATIDRTIENARKGFHLAHDLGITTVSLNVGNLADSKTPMDSIVSAIRELAQHADAAGLTLAIGSDSSDILAGILKRVDYDRARVNFDTAHHRRRRRPAEGRRKPRRRHRPAHRRRCRSRGQLGPRHLPRRRAAAASTTSSKSCRNSTSAAPQLSTPATSPIPPPVPITPPKSSPNCSDKEPPMNWQIDHHSHLDSTNRLAAERVLLHWQKNQPAEGLVITAETQSAGRGQHGRSFQSPIGGLYLSAIVETLPPNLRDKLALLAGVAAAEGIRRFTSIPIGLRWPNDLMLKDKKLGGILCESVVMGDRWAGIIGIGLNINTQIAELPPELLSKATSLLAHDNTPREVGSAQIMLLDALATILQTANAQGLTPILTRATQLDTLRGKQIELQNGEQRITGTAEGLGPNGELVLRAPQNAIVACAMGTLLSINGVPLR